MQNPHYKEDATGVEYYSTGADVIGYALSPIPEPPQRNEQVYRSALIFRDACQNTAFPAPSDEVVRALFLETYRHRRASPSAQGFVNWQRKELQAAIQSICTGLDINGARLRYNHLMPAPPAKKRGSK